jgi:SHS2 domain-containing protein
VPEGSYAFFDHAADVGVEVRADSLEQLFVMAGLALMAWIGPPPAEAAGISLPLQVEAEDLEALLVKWLRELLFLFHREHAYFLGTGHLAISGTSASAQADFGLWKDASYQDYQEVKAVTYHQLRVAREGDSWLARVIFDI